LLEYEERKRLKHIQAVQKQNREARELASRGSQNSVTSNAAANNRLYHEAQRKKQQHDEQLERQAATQFQQNSFQPKINKNSKKLAQKVRPQHVPVEDSLAYRGQLSSYRNQMLQQRSDFQAKIRASEPKINPTSEKILREKYNDPTGGSAARLTKPIGTVKQRTREGIDEPTFRPQLNSSGEWGREQNSGGDLYHRSQKWLQQKQSRLERERKEKENSELKQCSFKPQIVERNAQNLDNSYNSDISGYPSLNPDDCGGKSVAERQAEWAALRYLYNPFFTLCLPVVQ
jgi:hypothetical protein